MIDQKDIKLAVSRIVSECRPRKVILFGSYARGDAHDESDLDFLIVMPVTGTKRDTRLRIRRVLRSIPVPKDIVVSTPEEFAWRKQTAGTVEWPAVHEGVELYSDE